MKRLGPRLFFRWPFYGANMLKLRAVRVVAEEYWRDMIPCVHFGNDLAQAIVEFEDRVEDHLGTSRGDFPARWLPFVFEAALDGIQPERYAGAIQNHLDVVIGTGSRGAMFAQLRERSIDGHHELMSSAPVAPVGESHPGRLVEET